MMDSVPMGGIHHRVLHLLLEGVRSNEWGEFNRALKAIVVVGPVFPLLSEALSEFRRSCRPASSQWGESLLNEKLEFAFVGLRLARDCNATIRSG